MIASDYADRMLRAPVAPLSSSPRLPVLCPVCGRVFEASTPAGRETFNSHRCASERGAHLFVEGGEILAHVPGLIAINRGWVNGEEVRP